MKISLHKEWYSIKETSEILRVSTTVIFNRLTNRKSSLIEIKEFEYKFAKGRYFVHKDYILRCMKTQNREKEWYTVKEASEFLGVSENWLRLRFNKGEIPKSAYKKESKLLLHFSYVNSQKEYLSHLEKNFYRYEEVCQILDLPNLSIYGYVGRGVFKDVIHLKGGSYISKKEVERYKELVKDTIPLGIIKEELNLSQFQALEFIKNEPIIMANNVNGQQFYIKKDSYISFKNKLIYTVEMASEYLNTTYEITMMLIEKRHIKAFNVNGLGIRTTKDYLEEYIQAEMIPIEQLAMEMDTKVGTLSVYVNSGELKVIKFNNRRYFHKVEVEQFKNSFTAIKMKYWNTEKTHELFNEGMNYFYNRTGFKETVSMYEDWSRKQVNNSRAKKLKRMVTAFLISLNSLLNNLTKEIFYYSDDELKNLFKSLMESHLKLLYPFLNHCKSKRKCNYNGDYVWKLKNGREEESYTKDEWRGFTLEVLDVDKHFEKAIESKKYADTWLFALLHFSLSWRQESLKVFRPINLDLVGINGFEWFEHNTFTLEKSQIILKSIERNIKRDIANKNKKELVFVIPFIFEMPTAIAFTLCELHRRKMNEGNNKLITTSIQTKDIRTLFGDELPKFLNRRSNKTLMTYGWETAVKNGKGALAYWLGGFSRSHTQKIDMPNPVTQVYFVTTNTDASVEEMALHCFERGIFGWQVKVMIDAINNNQPLSLDEMTNVIAEVNKTFAPVMVDSLSKYAVTRHEQSISLLKELMSVPKKELKRKLEEISKLKSPSLLDHSQCLVGVKNCPYKNEVEYNLEIRCLGCKNRIDTNYIMDIVNVELFSLMDRLQATSLLDETSRIKYTHMIRTLAYILLDFRRAYDRYDENYIRSFIDIDELQKIYVKLEMSKFLHIKGENLKNGGKSR